MKVVDLTIGEVNFKIVKYYDARLDEMRFGLIEMAEDGQHLIVDKPTGCELLQYLFKHFGAEETIKL